MEQYCYNQFNEKFTEFLSNLNYIFKDDEELKVFNDKLEQVNTKKFIKRYVKLMKKNNDKIISKDESVFDESLYLIPNVDMSRLWKEEKLTEESKDNFWEYIQIMYVLGDIYINGKTDNMELLNCMLKNNNEEKEEEKNNSNMLNKLMSLGSSLKDMNDGDINLEKIVNKISGDSLDEINNQLTDIKGEDINEASENIKKIFSKNKTKSSDFICDMVSDISNELGNVSKEGKGIESILKIAENVSEKFKPKLESGEFDINDLLLSAQSVMKDIYGDDANNLTPMNVMTEFFKSYNESNN